jgi:hypothetical protein
LPAFPREPGWQSVYTTNISKKGCGFFHGEVLYPGERFKLILLKGIQQMVEVAWCRRVDEHCYAVGSRFLAASGAAASGAAASGAAAPNAAAPNATASNAAFEGATR